MLRVEHGSKLVAAPVSLPAEPLTDKPALPLERRTVPLGRDTALLMRESKQGVGGLMTPAYVAVALIAAIWLAAVTFALSRAEGRRRGRPRPRDSRSSGTDGPGCSTSLQSWTSKRKGCSTVSPARSERREPGC